jgi:phage N-6-adenine-methyltransferase
VKKVLKEVDDTPLSNPILGRVRNKARWHGRGSDWATPIDLFLELDEEFGFTLDVCASEWNRKCDRYFSVEDNALTQDWSQEICFMNPPYGKVLNDWMKKAYESFINGATVVCLVPAATDTAWWHNYAMKGDIRFLRGRLRFVTQEGHWQNTFLSSVIVVFKEEVE